MVERAQAVIENDINLRCNFQYQTTGDFFDPYNISKIEIIDSDGVTVLQTIVGANIIRDFAGKYHVVATAIANAKTIYDKWYFTPVFGAIEITKTNTCIVWGMAQDVSQFTTLANLKEYLGITETGDDTFLQHIINRVSKKIENSYCNRKFAAQDWTEYYKGDGTNRLLLRQYPINQIYSIYDDVDRQWPSSSAKDISAVAISYQTSGLIQLVGDIFINADLWSFYQLENIKITYNAGFATIPEDLEEACIKYCAVEYAKSKGVVAGLAKDRDFKSLIDEANEVLDNYKRIR